VIDAVGRCVVWCDEIEKALQGATSGSADGGVSADTLGTFLTWMQEKTSQSFVVVTANDIAALPPELLRKGRFDELFFVDIPTEDERVAVLNSTLRQFDRKPESVDVRTVAIECRDFTGAEVASTVNEALFAAFSDGKREPTTEDLIAAAHDVVPLVKTAKKQIDALREWGKQYARPASAPEEIQELDAPAKKRRVLDLGHVS
jgi:SpoVK/Ycf46/Vps4 family AAA+-type ATPase